MSARLWLWAAACVALGACKLDLDAPRAYACTRGVAESCAGGWVCGLDGYCHAPEPADRQCDRDAGDSDCFGWRCGLEGRCHPPTAAAWQCEPDGGDDCFGWHCGLEGRCYPLDAGVARPCDSARELAGTRADCPEQWRCGLENTCHPVGAPSPWQCSADRDCEAAWRCGPDHVCLDATHERPMFPVSPAPTVTRVHPQLWDARPDAVSMEPGDAGRTVAWVTGARLHHARIDPFGPRSDGSLPSWPVPLEVTLPAAPTSIAEIGGRTLAVVNDQVLIYDWADGGALTRRVDAGAVTLVAQRSEVGDLQLAAASGTGRRVSLIDRDGVMNHYTVDSGTVVAAAAPFLNTFNGPGLVAVSAPDRVAVVALGSDGGFSTPELYATAPFPPGFGVRQIAYWGGDFAFLGDGGVLLGTLNVTSSPPAFSFGPLCAPCAAGETMVGMTTFTTSGFQAICRGPAGYTDLHVDLPCVRSNVTEADPSVLESASLPFSVARAHGQLDVGEPPFGYRSVFAPGAPPEGMRFAAGLVTSSRAVIQVGGGAYFETPAGLLASATFSPAFAPTFRGLPGHGVAGTFVQMAACDLNGWASTPALTLPPPLALAPSGGFGFSNAATITGAGGVDSTGALLFAVHAQGHLYTARSVLDAGLQTFVDRAVPLGGVSVDSMVAVQSPPDAGLIDLYVLGSTGVARVRGLGERAWLVSPVSVPLGEWVKVLGEDSRARLAYQDGREVLLPTGVATTELLPAGATSLDFETLGTADFAITSAGLFVTAANPDGGVLGVWKPVALPASSSDPAARPDLAAARFFWGGSNLYLMTRWGTTYRIGLP